MTHRDLAWRGLGLGLAAIGAMTGAADRPGTHYLLGLLGFVIVLIGVVLIVQGRRVPAALRVERSRHRLLAQALRDHRRRRLPGPND